MPFFELSFKFGEFGFFDFSILGVSPSFEEYLVKLLHPFCALSLYPVGGLFHYAEAF